MQKNGVVTPKFLLNLMKELASVEFSLGYKKDVGPELNK